MRKKNQFFRRCLEKIEFDIDYLSKSSVKLKYWGNLISELFPSDVTFPHCKWFYSMNYTQKIVWIQGMAEM